MPSAGLLAFIVLLLSIVQIGAFLVLLPVIIWIWTAKDVTTALLLTVFLVLVGFIDTMLKPLVMGRGLTTPTIVIFVGVIGGTLAHGIVGLFIGPIILSVAWEMAAAWIRTEDRAGRRAKADLVSCRRDPPAAPCNLTARKGCEQSAPRTCLLN